MDPDESVEEGEIHQDPSNESVEELPPQRPANMAKYDEESKDDGKDYFNRIGNIKVAWDPDVHYWFNSVEASMKQAQVFKQWTKREVLQPLLPDHVRKKFVTSSGFRKMKLAIFPTKILKMPLSSFSLPNLKIQWTKH